MKTLIDDSFSCKQQKWGTWNSYDKDGNMLITSLTEDICIAATRFYLKQKFEKQIDDNARTYSGTVDGKL